MIVEPNGAVGELDDARRKLYRPGVLRCAKCGFRLVSNTLHAASGEVSPRETTENCPNDGAPMWRVSWEDECRAADLCWEQQVRRAYAAERAAAELAEVLAAIIGTSSGFYTVAMPSVLRERARTAIHHLHSILTETTP